MENALDVKESQSPAPGIFDLFLFFLKIGVTAFGGAMAILSVVEDNVVRKKGWLTEEDFTDGLALTQIVPGTVAVNGIAYVGYRLRGLTGAIVSTAAFLLPSFVIMLVLAELYLRYGQVPYLAGALKGISAGVVALLILTAYRIGKSAVKDYFGFILLGVTTAALVLLKVDIVLVVAGTGLAGIIFYAPYRKASGNE